MMTSSNGNIFRVTGPMCGEFIGHWGIPLTKASDAELWFFDLPWINGWVNNREAGDLRRHRTHNDVSVMIDITQGWGVLHLTKVHVIYPFCSMSKIKSRAQLCCGYIWESFSRTKTLNVDLLMDTELKRCLNMVDLTALGKPEHNKSSIDKWSALVQIMAWHGANDWKLSTPITA